MRINGVKGLPCCHFAIDILNSSNTEQPMALRSPLLGFRHCPALVSSRPTCMFERWSNMFPWAHSGIVCSLVRIA